MDNKQVSPDEQWALKPGAVQLFSYVVVEGQWDLKTAKVGDAGFDLPVVIRAINPTFQSKVNFDIDSNYAGTVLEEVQWIFPDGTPEDPIPFLEIPPHGGWAEVSTGLRVKLPDGVWGNIKGRSSTSWKRRLTVIEGTIDEGYVGPIFVLVQNNTSRPIRVHEGERLAQMILIPRVQDVVPRKVTELPNTERGHQGFGSSGA